MPRSTRRSSMPRRAANVSIRRDLLDAARASNINLSATLDTPHLAGIARSQLGTPVGTVAEQRTAIVAALDLLITGI